MMNLTFLEGVVTSLFSFLIDVYIIFQINQSFEKL